MTPLTHVTKAQAEKLALFVSDVHLQEDMPGTAQAFLDFLHGHAAHACSLYLLGDLFEYWAGDDDLATPFNRRIAEALRAVSDAGVALYWIAGNRDFLVGEVFAKATGATILPDPHVASFAGQNIVLAHGDAQCTDDLAYMAFRAQVRQPAWQQAFLAQSLAQRKQIIAGLRQGSRDAQQNKSEAIMDVNPAAIDALFDQSQTSVMIHGHTHRPARHLLADDKVRWVLPDWDCDASQKRGGWISLDAAGRLQSHDLAVEVS